MEPVLNNNESNKREKTATDIIMHKDMALQKLNNLMSNYISKPETMDKADKFAYWLEDYYRMLDFEPSFDSLFFKSYSRGDVIKVNLGYNIGNEEGGLHYCIVLDKFNSKKSGIITVIPLTSDKGKSLHFSEVNLGNEIYVNFTKKLENMRQTLTEKLIYITSQKNNDNPSPKLLSEITKATDLLQTLYKLRDELEKMKKGSIAMVNQITTISKLRIYDPQKTGDILSGIRISDESLDLINKKMK